MRINGAVFYYDYRDKQLRGAILDPTFGPAEALVSIPKSHAQGIEAQVVARPVTGLTLIRNPLPGATVPTESTST